MTQAPGTVTMTGKDIAFTVDYGFDSTHLPTKTGTAVLNGATANIPADIRAWKRRVLKACGRNPTIGILSARRLMKRSFKMKRSWRRWIIWTTRWGRLTLPVIQILWACVQYRLVHLRKYVHRWQTMQSNQCTLKMTLLWLRQVLLRTLLRWLGSRS